MGRLYFVAPHSNNKNYKGQHRTTIFLLFCPLLSLVVLCCLIFIFHANYHELPINWCALKLMDNYMVITCSLIVACCPLLFYVVWFFHMNYHEFSINWCALKFMDNYMVIICWRTIYTVWLEIWVNDVGDTLLLTILGTHSPFCHTFAHLSQHEKKKWRQIFPWREISPYLCNVKSKQIFS